METIKTWQERYEPFHNNCCDRTEFSIECRYAEIADLRAALEISKQDTAKFQALFEGTQQIIESIHAREERARALAKQAEAAPVGATIERGLAQKDANLFGTGFLVHGKRVAPEWVQIVLPDRAQRAGSGEVAPVAWRYQPKDGLPYPAYTEREAQALAYDPNPIPLYTAPPLQPDSGRDAALKSVIGDVLPAVGSDVLILHGRDDDEHLCTVTGYYAWPDLGGNKSLHRVFVRLVYKGTDTEQSRMLCDIAAMAAQPKKDN